MHIHEYQAKKLFQKAGITVPPFAIASNELEVHQAIQSLNLEQAVIKVQIHSGGRGKAGGVKIAHNTQEILQYSKELINKKIVTTQTDQHGLVSHCVIISPLIKFKKEYYIAATIDRSLRKAILIASKEGGMDIEEKPESTVKEVIPPSGKLYSFQLLRIAKFLGWEGETRKEGITLLNNFASLFAEKDASLLEINPLVETEEGKLWALDAKASFDDNALFRQKEIASMKDPSQLAPNEVKATEWDLAYVGLNGDIGCMVNGAGLAMATMDMIHYYGGRPANFLDVGGSASKEKIAHGFKIILEEKNVKAIFVNIFGGIMDCGILAEGIVEATKEVGLKVPLIVRMEGTNASEGRNILATSHLKILSANTMDEGAQLAVGSIS